MKTLEEIKDEVAREFGWKNWSSCYDEDGITNAVIDTIAKRYADEVSRQAITDKVVNVNKSDIVFEETGTIFPNE